MSYINIRGPTSIAGRVETFTDESDMPVSAEGVPSIAGQQMEKDGENALLSAVTQVLPVYGVG